MSAVPPAAHRGPHRNSSPPHLPGAVVDLGVLGEYQDACVAQQRVIALLEGLGDVVDLDVVFVAGRLVQREELSRLATRDSWSAAWRQVRRRAETLGE